MLEVVRTVELDAVDMGAASDPLRFRIEIIRELSGKCRYFARLCRWESFEMSPTSANSDSEGSTEDILIEDAFWDWSKNPAVSAEVALDLLLAKLSAQLPNLKL
ncbi:MAG: hypothetical protein GY937_17265 [bacterium]|nr:hypothetical protein [bacterium]